MAPRTREQQDAYNAKRRAENAAKKAGKPMPDIRPAAPPHELEPTGKPAKTKVKQNLVVGDMAEATVVRAPKAKPEPTREASRERLAGKVNAERHAVGADVTPRKGGKVKQSKPVAAKSAKPATPVAKKATPKPTPAPAAPAKFTAMIPNATMDKAYIRNGAPGGGMQRGKNFQATVTFTPDQFNELRDKALFNQRSLAEQIRWCVIQQLRTSA